jgi:hypothetical protein
LDKQFFKLSNRYELCNEGKWKKHCQIGGRLLKGQYEEYSNGDSNAQRNKFKEIIQRMTPKGEREAPCQMSNRSTE